MSTTSTRNVGTVDCLSKGIPVNLLCSNSSYSSNRTPIEKKPCRHLWILKDNSKIFQKEKHNFIQYYLTVELEPPKKRKTNSTIFSHNW